MCGEGIHFSFIFLNLIQVGGVHEQRKHILHLLKLVFQYLAVNVLVSFSCCGFHYANLIRTYFAHEA